MGEVVDITEIREKDIKSTNDRLLDIKASYTALDHCRRYINMNNLPELRELKLEIQRKMKEFREILRDVR